MELDAYILFSMARFLVIYAAVYFDTFVGYDHDCFQVECFSFVFLLMLPTQCSLSVDVAIVVTFVEDAAFETAATGWRDLLWCSAMRALFEFFCCHCCCYGLCCGCTLWLSAICG